MAKTLIERVFLGSDEMYARAEQALAEASAQYSDDTAVSFPDTAYSLPVIYAMTGTKINNLGELKAIMPWIKGQMTRKKRTHDVFTSGIATACAAEVIEACKYIDGQNPYDHDPCWGHCTDAEVRELGLPLVTGDIPGFVVLIGPAPSVEEAVATVKSYQTKSIFVFMVGGIIDQMKEAGVACNFGVRVVCEGYDLWAAAHVVSVAVRAAMIFGAVEPGDYDGIREYCFKRVNAMINAYAPVDDITVAAGAGCISYGFPVVTNDQSEDMWRVPMSLIVQPDTTKFVETSIEARRIKLKITNIDIPNNYANAFEGEIIRRGDMQIEADGSRKDCVELVRTKEMSEVEDHKIIVEGPDFDEMEVGTKINLAYIVEVAGKKMQADFESVFERKFHAYLNCIEGVMHTGQRDMIRIRVSKSAFEAGFRAKHIGEVLYAKVKSDFDAVVDKCQVIVVTDPEKVAALRAEATETFNKRDERLQNLTDESVDEFYTCIMCQAFSPSHVCIVTPERLGLCGAVSWLDAKATHELDPTGPCQIVPKTGVIDDNIGKWEAVNEAVEKYSAGALSDISLYSIMEDPMTSCGCFECICGIEPFSNGVVIVNREHAGMTPMGMSFSELASMTGGGVQTPGFMGHGKHFIASKKFMKAEGGVMRIVWLPKKLKEEVADNLNKTAKELYDIDDFCSMIADETVAEDPETLVDWLTEQGHPVFGMEPLM